MLQPPGLLEINRNGAFFWMVCWHNHEIAKMKSTILRKKKKKVIDRYRVRLANIIFANLFYYLVYFCYYS